MAHPAAFPGTLWILRYHPEFHHMEYWSDTLREWRYFSQPSRMEMPLYFCGGLLLRYADTCAEPWAANALPRRG